MSCLESDGHKGRMSCLVGKSRKHEHDRSSNHGAILLEKQIYHAGRKILPVKMFKLKELSVATNGFTNFKLFNGCTRHYHAVIDGVRVLISQLESDSPFQNLITDLCLNEISILSNIHHKNIIKLLGCCLDASNPIFVFEFIPNGNLHDRIRAQLRLQWPVRLRISIGVAEALVYLHHHGETPIIHRDVKPMKVYLDDNYNPKLSGFIISVSKPKDEERSDSVEVAGTPHYLDPEYLNTNVLTEKIDVYGFGMLLLVLFLWKLPSSQQPRDEEIHFSAFMSISESLGLELKKDGPLYDVIQSFPVENVEVLDGLEEGVGARRECLSDFLQLARRCLNWRGEHRPTMKEALGELRRIEKIYKQE